LDLPPTFAAFWGRLLHFIVTHFFADANIFFKNLQKILKIFAKGHVRSLKTVPTHFQNEKNTGRSHFPTENSHTNAPRKRPMV
jgi:hypothetical protein